MNIKRQIRAGLPKVGYGPYNQVHAHSTANPNSTAQNEADYMGHKDITTGFYTHVVGNGQIIQTAEKGRGAWDVGGDYNGRGYASVELIESHRDANAFWADYKIYVDLLRQLCAEAGVSPTLDSGSTGVLTHDYCRRTQPNNKTTHVDPYPYLAKWGVSASKFRSDLANGYGGQVSGGSSGASTSGGKSIATLAQEVIDGKWGNNPQRNQALTNAGYNAAAVQAEVNRRLGAGSGSSAPKPQASNLDAIARSVMAGNYGNNPERANRLRAEGYDPNAVQARVNQLLGAGGGSKPQSKSIDTIAREVIAGKWGNGSARKANLERAGYNYSQVQARVNQLM